MKDLKRTFSLSLVIFSLFAGMAGLAAAQRRDDREIRDAVRSLNSKIEDFETNLRYQMQSSSASNTRVSEVSTDIRELKSTVRQFQDFYERRRENANDVRAIVDAAKRIDEFLETDPQNRRVEDDWTGVRRQIERIANNYGVTPNWSARSSTAPQPNRYPSPAQPVSMAGFSGTYDLDATRSERIDDIVNDANVAADKRADLTEKLTAPQQIALDIRGDRVVLATTNASPLTFTADGSEKTETTPDGRTIRVKAMLTGTKLVVSSLGGERDFNVTFDSEDNGRILKVSRRITTEYLSQTVWAESIYNKTDSVARLGVDQQPADNTTGGYSDNDGSGGVANGGNSPTFGRSPVPSAVTTRPGNYTVPNGVAITGILENELNTKVSQNNDRFRLTVQSPDDFRGAVIEGYVSNISRSGTVTGDPKMTLNFERITLRDGKTFDFAGNVQSVQAINGKNVSVDNEGTLKGESQTKDTVKRGGIGAGIGAVIGAIAGGAKGAAIGAIIGGGGGAGSVAIQGKNDIQLQQGSSVTVVSTSPMR